MSSSQSGQASSSSSSSSSLYTGSQSSIKDESKWPQIETGASLLLAWQLLNRRVLIVGGGNVAADRLRSVLPTGARVTVVCPQDGMGEEVRHRVVTEAFKWSIDWRDRTFTDEDVNDEEWDMVLTALDDPALSKHIHAQCKKRHFNINVADVPPLCDFYFGSVIRRGPLQIMISTNGKGPRLANRIRRGIEDSLPDNVGSAIDKIGGLRAGLRRKAPGSDAESVKKRMEWMVRVTDSWTLDELAQMTQDEQEAILQGFEDDFAASFTTISKSYWRRLACPYWLVQLVNPAFWLRGATLPASTIERRREKCPVYQSKRSMSTSGGMPSYALGYSALCGALAGGAAVLALQGLRSRHLR